MSAVRPYRRFAAETVAVLTPGGVSPPYKEIRSRAGGTEISALVSPRVRFYPLPPGHGVSI